MSRKQQGRAGQAAGRAAEELAAGHLEGKGLKVVARNWRTEAGELDLVAFDGPTLVFVEVKARRQGGLGRPEEAIGPAKQRRLVQAAAAYLAGLEGPLPPCRFDVVAVETGGPRARVRHLPDAFRPSGGQ